MPTVNGKLINHTNSSNILFYYYPRPQSPPYYEKVPTSPDGTFSYFLEPGVYKPIKVPRYDPPPTVYVPCCGPSQIDVPAGGGAVNVPDIDGCGYYVTFQEPPPEEENAATEEGTAQSKS